jgi:hypothetical protein
MKLPFLNFWGWSPGGYIWEDEEKSQNYSLVHNMRTIANSYAYFMAQHVDGIGGDDIRRGGNPRYVNYFGVLGGASGEDATTWIAGSNERKLYEQGYVNEGPTAEWSPNMAQLTHAIHESISNLWQQIAEDGSAGEWGAPP